MLIELDKDLNKNLSKSNQYKYIFKLIYQNTI